MNLKIITISILILNSMFTFSQTKIIAHRGFSNIAPENTLIAFQKAIESGADYFELDVHKTKDNVIVVIHDSSIDRTSSNDMKGKISEMNYSDLTEIRVGYPSKFGDEYKNEKIPTLKEALELAKGKIKVCIEIKVYGVEKEVLEIVDALEINKDIIIFSFYSQVLTKIRQLSKSISILFLIDSADKMTIKYANEIKVNAIGVGHGTTITKEYLDSAHQQGIEVWKWTVNDENEMQQLIDLGLDGLITNAPDKAVKKLNTAANNH